MADFTALCFHLLKSVLQTEAAVQHDPTNASAWFTLGVRQQENEQEDKAIQALNRAVQLDPKHSAALLALAVSHTNENDRAGALDAIGRWVDVYAETNEMYREALRAHRALNHSLEGGAFLDKQRDFVECLMTMARATPDGQIDADIQIALGVLLNASEVRPSFELILFRICSSLNFLGGRSMTRRGTASKLHLPCGPMTHSYIIE